MSESRAAVLLGNLWYMIATRLFDKVCTVTELDADRISALREIALRPMDFEVSVEERADGLEALLAHVEIGGAVAAASPSGIE
jgi:hypothetical protein